MFKKKIIVSVIALAVGTGGVFAAASLRTGEAAARAGSLRTKNATTSVKTTAGATTTEQNTSSRMATLAGVNSISTKPKLPTSASAGTVSDLQKRLDQLAENVADLSNAGVDENAVRSIITNELSEKDYATNAEVDNKLAGISPSAEIQYDNATGNLQYKDSDGNWQTFANRSDFKGADGDSVELRKNETNDSIEWKKRSDTDWTKLVDLDDITRAAGVVDTTQLESAVEQAIRDAHLASKADLDNKANKSEVLSTSGTFETRDGKIVYVDGDIVKDVVSISDIKGTDGAPGSAGQNACEPEYSSTKTADGDTLVTITCKDDSTKVLGQYTVDKGDKGTDGQTPCTSISFEQDTSYTGTDGVRYNVICVN